MTCCAVAIPISVPAANCEGDGRGGEHRLEEKIQPHGLENPGEDLLSGLCLTCCHVIRLVGIQKDPHVIWTSVCVCVSPEEHQEHGQQQIGEQRCWSRPPAGSWIITIVVIIKMLNVIIEGAIRIFAM